MSIVICNNFDTDFNPCPGKPQPDITSDIIIDGTQYKWGSGSAKANVANTDGVVWWQNLASGFLPTNEGAISLWFRTTATKFSYQVQIRHPSNDNSRIDLDWSWTGSQYYVQLAMYTDTGINSVFGSSNPAGSVTTNWINLEVDWLWNDASGKSEVFWNGVSQFTKNGGNTKTRASATPHMWYELRNDSSDVTSRTWMDDPVISDTRLHTSDFTVPALPLCVCAAQPLTFGPRNYTGNFPL